MDFSFQTLQTISFIWYAIILLIVSLLFFNRYTIKRYPSFFVLIIVTIIGESFCEYFRIVYRNNLIIYNIYPFINSIAIFLFLFNITYNYYKKIIESEIVKYVIISIMITMWIIENFIVYDILIFNPYSIAICYGINLLFSVYLINIMFLYKKNNLLKDFEVIAVIGVVIYSFNNTIVNVFYNNKKIMDVINAQLDDINAIIQLISYLLFLYATICLIKREKSLLSY